MIEWMKNQIRVLHAMVNVKNVSVYVSPEMMDTNTDDAAILRIAEKKIRAATVGGVPPSIVHVTTADLG